MEKKGIVKKQLKQFVVLFTNHDEYRQKFLELSRAAKSDEWKFAMHILWNIKNGMAKEMLEDPKFSALSAEDKDRIQTVYHNISEWINFLTNPTAWVGKYNKIQLAQQQLNKLIKGESRVEPEMEE